MSERGPDFDELVGTDLDAEERARLLRVHELLVAVGPPPDFEPEVPPVPAEPAVTRLQPRRRTFSLVALAAALAVAVFGAGYFVGDRGGPGTFEVIEMAGTSSAADARGSLEIFDIDEAGNWPMELEVDGLRPSTSGRAYELWLTKGSQLAALCGSFRAEPDGTTKVPLNAPYRLKDFDSWVIVEEGTKTPLLTTT
jgi:hypothetical protein